MEISKEESARYQKEYRAKNKERLLRQKKEYYLANREKILKQAKEYRLASKEKILERGKEWREKNKEKLAKQRKEYYEENKEKILKRDKEYRKRCIQKLTGDEKERYEKNKKEKQEASEVEKIVCDYFGARHIATSKPFDGMLSDIPIEVKNFKTVKIPRNDLKKFKQKMNEHGRDKGYFAAWGYHNGAKAYAKESNIELFWLQDIFKELGLNDGGLSEEAVMQVTKEKNKEHYFANRKKILRQKKEYHQRNKERRAAYNKEYRQKNKEKIAAKKKEYRQKNKDKISAQRREAYRKKKLQKEEEVDIHTI